MMYYYFVLLSMIVLITGCSQNEEQNKGTGSSTPSTAIVSATSSQQTARIALVIGNADYREDFNPLQLGKLSNPVNDAADMAKVLKGLGFQVFLKTDLHKRTAMKQAVREFIQRLKANDVGLFYFSGHGFQHNSINYLVPLRADIHNDIDIEGEALAVQYVLRQMERATKGVKLMILDACRENIPEDFFHRSKGAFAGVTKGFSSSLNAPMNTLIIYATAANEISWGSPRQRNSVYTKHLVDVLRQQPHAMVEILLKEVRQRVVQDTQNIDEPQVPWESGSLVTQPFCFGACGSEEQRQLAQQRVELARLKSEEQEKLAQQRAELEQQQIQLEQQRTQWAQEQARQQEAARQAELAEKLRECQSHFQANRLTTGKGGTAFACYQAVLEKYPSNTQALTGLKNIEARYVTWAKSALNKGQLDNTKQYLARLRQVNPQSSQLVELKAQFELEWQRAQLAQEQTRLRIQKEEQERLANQKQETEQYELTQKLRECQSHFQANRLTTGKEGTALVCYQAVLKKDPNNAQALTGLKNIEARYVRWAKTALNKGQLGKTKQYLARLRQVNSQSSQLALLEKRLTLSSYRYTDNGDNTNANLSIIPGRYLLQVGSFRNEYEADNLKGHLATLGISATIQRTSLTDKARWYRVQVGPFTDLDELNKTRSLLTENSLGFILLKF